MDTRVATYGYDAASNLVTATLPAANGYVETRSYDNAGRLSGVQSQKGASVLADITYTREQVGNPLSETRAGASPVTKTFTYDFMDRLTGVCFQAGGCPGGSDPFIRWDYDGVGNRLSEQRPTGTTSYTYDQMDRMLTAGATSYTYDRNGNQLSAGSRTFTWDLASRLKTTVAAGTTTTYSYDGDGKRLQASTGNGSNQKTNFSWDPNNGLPLLVREAAGNNSLLRRYVNGLAGPIFMSTTASNAFYYHTDALGSVRDITDSAGVTQNSYDYEPYGTVRSQSGALGNFVKFTGQYQDPTGLYHLRARQYDPVAGRFLSFDPAEPQAPRPLASSYLYSDARPTVLLDPSGWRPAASRRALGATLGATSPVVPRSLPSTQPPFGQRSDRDLASSGKKRSYCRPAKPKLTRESDNRIGFYVDISCDISIFWYSVVWRASSPENDFFDNGNDSFTFNWGKRSVHWSHTLSDDFSPESGTVVVASGTFWLYGVQGIPTLPPPQLVEFIVIGYTL